MAVIDYIASEIATELVMQLLVISRKAWRCKNTAKQLITLILTIKKIRYRGVEPHDHHQAQIGLLFETLEKCLKITNKLLSSRQWNLYRQLTLARKMEKLEKTISFFLKAEIFTHILEEDSDVQPSCDEVEAETEETGGMFIHLWDTAVEAFSFTTADGDSSRIVSNTSPIYSSRGSIITSCHKGQLLGQGSFGSVYEGIAEDGDFFAINEVSLLDQGSHAQECIQQLEAEIALLSQLQRQNIMSSSSSSLDCDSTCSLVTPSLEFPDRISFREMDLRDSSPSGDVVVASNSTNRNNFILEIALLSQLQRQNIMSSSSSSVDSDSTCSFITPSLEFPDRISLREMDFSEAGPSGIVAVR